MLGAAALALSIFPAPARWPLAAGLGGALGGLGARALDAANLAPPLTAMAAAALVGLLLLYVLGFSPAAVGTGLRSRARPRPNRGPPDPAFWRGCARASRAGAAPPPRSTIPWRCAASRLLGPVAEDEDDEAEEAPAPRRAATVDLPPRARRRADPARQASLDLRGAGEHLLPPLDLLREVPPAKDRRGQRGFAAAERAAPRIGARGFRRARPGGARCGPARSSRSTSSNPRPASRRRASSALPTTWRAR